MRSSRIAISCLVVSGAIAGCSAQDGPTASGSTSQALTSVNVFHSQQSGGGANGSVNYQDSNKYFYGWFDAWENKTGKSRSASLNFSGGGASLQQVCYDEQICVWDPNTWTCSWETYQYCYQGYTNPYWIFGYGDVPTGDFRVGGHTARLTTDLSKDSGFQATQCGWDSSSWTYTCSPVTGTIDLTWRDNGHFTFDQNGVTSTQSTWGYGQYSTHSTGHQSNASADVTGTFLGYDVTTQGNVTLSKENNVSKDMYSAPPPPPPGDAGPPPPPPPPDGG